MPWQTYNSITAKSYILQKTFADFVQSLNMGIYFLTSDPMEAAYSQVYMGLWGQLDQFELVGGELFFPSDAVESNCLILGQLCNTF